MDTASFRLRSKLDLAFPTLNAYATQFWHSPHVRDLYPIYLGKMHMIVRSAVPLIEAAAKEAQELSSADDVAAGMVPYLTHHAKEELGHDSWLLEDLAAIGFDAQQPLRQIPPSSVANLVGAQYYWLFHYHPVSLLGHMAAIEGYHPPTGFAKHLQDRTSYPREGFRAISRHERLDIQHKQDLYDLIDSLPLELSHEKMMAMSGLHTMSTIIDVMDEMYTKCAAHSSEPANTGIQSHA